MVATKATRDGCYSEEWQMLIVTTINYIANGWGLLESQNWIGGPIYYRRSTFDQLWIVIIIRGYHLLVMIYPHIDGTNPQQQSLKLGWGASGISIIVIIIILTIKRMMLIMMMIMTITD
jgi:hypothetical protein